MEPVPVLLGAFRMTTAALALAALLLALWQLEKAKHRKTKADWKEARRLQRKPWEVARG